MEFFFLHWWLSYPHTSSCPHVYMIFVQEPSDNCLWSKKIMCAMQFCSTWRSVLHLKTKLLIMWSNVKFTICAAIYADFTQYPFGRCLRSFVWSKNPTQKYCLWRKIYKYHEWSYPHILTCGPHKQTRSLQSPHWSWHGWPVTWWYHIMGGMIWHVQWYHSVWSVHMRLFDVIWGMIWHFQWYHSCW